MVNYLWNIINGTIVQGQGSNTIEVIWDIDSEGLLTIVGSNDSCSSNVVDYNVIIELSTDQESNYSIARLWNEVFIHTQKFLNIIY